MRHNINEAKAIKLMLANTSLIKRPVLQSGKHLLVGFADEEYSLLFGK